MTAIGTLDFGSRSLASRSQRSVLAVFAVTMFTSALLLFGIQPLFAKLVLPRVGGSPAVWSVALVFFQTMLLLGYAYAHLLTRSFSSRVGVVIHVSVIVAGLLFLPIMYPSGFEEAPQSGLALWLLALFAVGVGFPFFIISANAPLLQYWFSRSGHPHSIDPYFLYGASNLGSFSALLLYPFVMEPLLGLDAHTEIWSWGYSVLAVLVGACGVLMIRLAWQFHEQPATVDDAPSTAIEPATETGIPGWAIRLRWICLSLVPSGLLVSVTVSITTDVAAAPFLWVAPLALFLLTFVLTFQRVRSIRHRTVLTLHSAITAPMIVLLFIGWNHISMVAMHLAVFFVSAMVCHGELVARRPKARHLTEFYLYMSVGGVLGGLFASLIAPQIFNQVLEYPILLVLVFFCRGDVVAALGRLDWRDLWPAGLLISGAFGLWLTKNGGDQNADLLAGVPIMIALLIATRKRALAQLFVVSLSILLGFSIVSRFEILDRQRSFFGVISVSALDRDGLYHLLMHGTTLHGAEQRADAAGGELSGRPEPLTYFYMSGPLAVAVKQLRAASGTLSDVALIGVGTGAMACHREPGERWRFYEIDPDIMRVARDTRYFRFLSECGESAGVVIGDGRISLTHEPDGKFDVIVLDAFSSDTVPAHLLTREALALYFAKMKPNGAIVLHISNRHMDLAPIVAALANDQNATAFVNAKDDQAWSVDKENLRFSSRVAVVARDRQRLSRLAADNRWEPLVAEPGARPWTDNYSNILGAIYRKLTAGD